MNVALPALIVFVCLLPGFIFRSRLKLIESTSLDYSPFGRVVSESIFWAAVLHAIWIGVMCPRAGDSADTGPLLQLLSSNLAMHGEALERVSLQTGRIEFYFGSLLVASYVVPTLIRRVITATRVDRIGSPLSTFFRFGDAPWYYLLTGADFKHDERPDLIVATAIVSVAGQPVLFKGVLNDFYFKSDGSLDRLILEETMRRPLAKDKGSADAVEDIDRFYPVDGDSFVIQYDQVITLNIQYLKLTPADEDLKPQPLIEEAPSPS
ncbi:hypothetical protein [Pelomonas sp. KK5]|uniref:hypothetical protein n=1 Tax=Pelomonas sp. KK5 TaxID=1855730 RepID=UPI00097BBC9E|nr:hypothetical protein [Pelomonas sp. KK5]